MVRIEAGQALWVAYRIYRAPNGKYGVVPGALGRSEFGLEIILAIAHQVYALGLSFDKAIALQKFFFLRISFLPYATSFELDVLRTFLQQAY